MSTTHLLALLRQVCDPCTADPYDGRYITITPDELVRFLQLLSRQPSQLDPHPPHRDCGRADCAPHRVITLFTHLAPGVPEDVARDAISTVREQYRGTDWGKAAECICDAIDAAMHAASQAQKNGE